jgi:acyl CoA:acetate/3-ketoacid CoA transferase alpha subunit
MTFLAGTLTIGGIAAAFVATLINQDSTGLYIVCAVVAAAGLLLMLLEVARRRRDAAPWYALAPMAIVVALLGVAASGATCGVACIAWGTPAAAATLAAPDIRSWFKSKQPLKRPKSV